LAEPTVTTQQTTGQTASNTGATATTGSETKSPIYKVNPIENKLSKFASHNYIFTFGPLSKEELNFPDATYRKYGPSIKILRSGGTGNDQVRHIHDKENGITTEYFIDDVEIATLMSPNSKTKQTNATSITFKVTEPYSMGMFLRSLQTASLEAGHANYTQAPFLLTVEFIGWDDKGNFITIPKTKRMFPLTLSNVSFNVTEQGSVYNVEAIPFHDQSFSDQIQSLQTDLDIEGETILEMLQTGANSLASQLNTRQVELEQTGNRTTGDQYVIIFPKSRSSKEEKLIGSPGAANGATASKGSLKNLTTEQKQQIYTAMTGVTDSPPAAFDEEVNKILGVTITRTALGETVRAFAEDESNCNEIGLSKLSKSYLDSGKTYFGKPAFVANPDNPGVFKRGDIVISAEAKKIQFPKGAKIQDIIEEVILLSEYGRQFITKNPDGKGFIKWFKIESQVYLVDDPENVKITGDSPKVFVYRVVPYGVHTSRLVGPTDVPSGYNELAKTILKEYNYIYTGKNDDILNFDIQIDSAFYTALNSDMGQLHADSVTAGQDSLAAQEPGYTAKQSSGSDVKSDSGNKTTKSVPASSTGTQGGGSQQHSETMITRSLNDAIVNSNVDMVSVELEIWGDPYYVSDTGMGNYNATETDNPNITEDETVDYQNSEVDIVINFRTPLDYNENGTMIFPDAGTAPVGQFSGIYQVTEVTNSFSGGQFTQKLQTMRRPNQPTDTNNAKPTTKGIGIEEDPAAQIAPLPPQDVSPGAYIPPDFGNAAASVGGVGGASSWGSDFLGDLNAAYDAAGNALNNAQGQLSGLLGNIQSGISGAVSNATNAAGQFLSGNSDIQGAIDKAAAAKAAAQNAASRLS